ncbi:MAG: hypothetical protein ACE5RS_00145 [Nitrosopumilus sp.]
MPKRITIVLDDDIDKKLRVKQATMIRKSTSSISFSQIINETLKKSL